MEVHILKPYREDKNLGRAYNEALASIGDNDWACLCDLDTCFLTPDAGTILHQYALRFPHAGLLTCFTNRISPLSKMQLLNESLSNDFDMISHARLAEEQKKYLYQVTQVDRDISGMVMMISRKIWLHHPFPEDAQCLGVDTYYNRRIRSAGKKIFRMDGLYVFHLYRALSGIYDKKHLQ